MNGILNVDKPLGMTSHDVVAIVRKIAEQRRVGHAGTLDPLATGVLLLCLGKATRLAEYVVGQRKVYHAALKLGETTNTYDAEGDIIAQHEVTVSPAEIETALLNFCGDIEQMPPMFSAIKQKGQPLYKLARRGIEVERPPRPVTIYKLDAAKIELPFVELLVECSAGTYIRSLAHDLGRLLGCGAYLSALRRTAIGRFRVDDGVEIEALRREGVPAFLQSPDQAVIHLPAINVTQQEKKALLFGQRILRQPKQPAAELIRAYGEAGEFIGLLTNKNDQWQPKKILSPS